MKHIFLIALTISPLLHGQFTPDESSRNSGSFPAFTRAGKREIQSRELLLNTFSKTGKPIPRDLFLLFDPVTRYFLFHYTGEQGRDRWEGEAEAKRPASVYTKIYSGRSAAYIGDPGLILFVPLTLSVGAWGSTEKATSMDDAERRAIRMLEEDAIEAAGSLGWPTPKYINLVLSDGTRLPIDFSAPPLSPFPEPISIVRISESASGVEVTLKGQWEEKITLSRSLGVLKMERLEGTK